MILQLGQPPLWLRLNIPPSFGSSTSGLRKFIGPVLFPNCIGATKKQTHEEFEAEMAAREWLCPGAVRHFVAGFEGYVQH